MKPWTWMTTWVVALMPLATLPADVQADHDDWFDGTVDVRVEVNGGEGSVFAPGEPVRLEFETNESAYYMVYGIDTDGYVRLLFPRYWEDDGWVKAGRKVRLRADDLAWPADRWGADGIVYVEAVASPTPFDFHGAGLVREAGASAWYDGHAILRIHGDPFLGFNDVHQRLFADWDDAVFAVDYTYFYVGRRYEAPRYLGYRYRRVYVRPPHSGFEIGIRFGWSWEFGDRYCRPVYARYYVPGVHYVHHHVYSHHHVAYRHEYGRYAQHGHYGYHDGWNGSRYRVVHDTRHRSRVTQPPERKRHRSVANLREALERQRVKRSAPTHETRRDARSETRREDRREGRRGSAAVARDGVARRGPEDSSRPSAAERRAPTQRSTAGQAVGTRKRGAARPSAAVKPKAEARSTAEGAKRNEGDKSASSARTKKAKRR